MRLSLEYSWHAGMDAAYARAAIIKFLQQKCCVIAASVSANIVSIQFHLIVVKFASVWLGNVVVV